MRELCEKTVCVGGDDGGNGVGFSQGDNNIGVLSCEAREEMLFLAA